MAEQVSISGALVAGPTTSSDGTFPAGVVNVGLTLLPTNKAYAVQAGSGVRQVNSPSAYVALSGVGSDDSVTQAHTLHFRSTVGMRVRLTMTDAPSPDVMSVLFVLGTLMYEVDPVHPLTLIEVQGAGTIEWSAFGNQ